MNSFLDCDMKSTVHVPERLLPWLSVIGTCLTRGAVNSYYPTSALISAINIATFDSTGPVVYSSSFADGDGGTFVVFRVCNEPTYVCHVDSTKRGSTPAEAGFAWIDIINHFHPVAAPDGKGGLLILRASTPDVSGYGAGLYVQRISPDCSRLWGENGVLLTSVSTEGFSVEHDGNGGAYVAWHEDDGSGTAVYAQHISSDGRVQWTSGGITFADPVVC
jgi:hypothetical protein